ncbi:ABC transporter ATP-binding protein [Patescibacteria group bacterium]|nr:ABC transporter ATP-binding protein [Patescibacteria group bacterium]
MNKKLLLHTKGLTKDYVNGDIVTNVLKGVDFEVHEGEFIAIMGHSGSGKSTLMHILGFLDTPTTGEYVFEGEDTTLFDENKLAEIRNKKIGFVFQAFNLLKRTSALENVKLPMIYAGIEDEEEKERRAREALKAVGLGDKLDNKSNELSGGQQQRVAIARALINKPRLIFADEPTGNLDSTSSKEIMEIFRDLHKEGNTIIIVTHETDIAAYAERTIRMDDGVIK